MVLILNLVSLGGVIMASFYNRITYSEGYPNNVELGYLGQYLGGYRLWDTPESVSLPITDIYHHHISLSIVCMSLVMVSGYEVLPLNINPMSKYSSLRLSISLTTLELDGSVTSQHLYSKPSFYLLSYDVIAASTVYLHHTWITGLGMIGSLSHLGIYLIRDYIREDRVSKIGSIILDKSSVLSSMSYISILLGCHTLGIYVHNDSS